MVVELTFFARFGVWTSATAVSNSLNTTHFACHRRVLIRVGGSNYPWRRALCWLPIGFSCVTNDLWGIGSLSSIAHELGRHICVSFLINGWNAHNLTGVDIAMTPCCNKKSCGILSSSKLMVIFLWVIYARQQRLVPLIFIMEIILYSKKVNKHHQQNNKFSKTHFSRANLCLKFKKSCTYAWVIIIVHHFILVLFLLCVLRIDLVFHDHHWSVCRPLLIESLASRLSWTWV